MGERKILITAVKWSADRTKVLDAALRAAYKKYGDNMLVVVGYTAPGLKIATAATSNGFSVQMFAPDLEKVKGEHVDSVNGITITSSTKGQYITYIVDAIDAVMAFDRGDPLVLTATRRGKQVWFPMGR